MSREACRCSKEGAGPGNGEGEAELDRKHPEVRALETAGEKFAPPQDKHV